MPSGPDQPKVKELKHFMRPSASASSKELVVEKVSLGSASFEFLKRMEDRRLTQECNRFVDMRGRTPGECKKYNYRNRVFWMDDRSYQLFKQGLKENNGVFTIGVYENIINGQHTYRGMEAAQAAARQKTEQVIAQSTQQTAQEEPYIFDSPMPELLPLGYYRRRRELRIQYVMQVMAQGRDEVYTLKTRDISLNGLQLAAKHILPYELDQTVQISFIDLGEGREPITDVCYRVTHTEQVKDEYRVHLQRLDKDNDRLNRRLGRLIGQQSSGSRGKRRVDVEDERLTVLSTLMEHLYSLSTALIPFAIVKYEGGISLSTLGQNENNTSSFDILRDQHGHIDMAGLSAPDKLLGFYKQAQLDGQNDPLLLVYKRHDEADSEWIAEFECPTQDIWLECLREHLGSHQARVFKVMLRPVQRPDPLKIYHKLERIIHKSIEHAEKVVIESDRINIVGALVDVTHEIKQWDLGLLAHIPDNKKRAMVISDTHAKARGYPPRHLQFGYREQRVEDRYKVKVEAELIHDKNTIACTSRDLSLRGVCLELKKLPAVINRGDRVHIGFPALHRRAGRKVKLINMPYEVCRTQIGQPCLLHLKRVETRDWADYAAFIKDMFARNSSKIEIDMEDSINAAHARLFTSLVTESTASLPFIISKNPKTLEREVTVGMPGQAAGFIDFFEVAEREYDFSPLTVSRRLSWLTADLRKRDQNSLTLYLYKKRIGHSARFRLYSACEQEFESEQEKNDFLAKAQEHDYLVVKVILCDLKRPDDVEWNNLIETLMDMAPHQANKMRTEYQQIFALGDMIDITRQVQDGMDLGRYEHESAVDAAQEEQLT